MPAISVAWDGFALNFSGFVALGVQDSRGNHQKYPIP
jgi:hypothetical protein